MNYSLGRILELTIDLIFPDSGEHCHDDEHRHVSDNVARRKLWIASILCVIFMIGEAVGKKECSTYNFK